MLLLLWTAPLPAQEADRDAGLTPEHVAKLRSVVEAAIAPDGSNIAFTRSAPRDPKAGDDGPAHIELYVVDAEGHSRPFITGDVSIRALDWTPDGSAISYLSKRGDAEHVGLHRIPIGGGESQAVLEPETNIQEYAWHPDGDRVAYLATEPTPEDLQQLRDKGFNQRIYEEDWEFVRLWIAETGDEADEPRMLDIEGNASELSWSPDGSKVAVALAPTPGVDDFYMKRRVHVIDPTNGEILIQLENPGKLGHVAWSPDGGRLALISGADIHDPAAGRLMVADLETGELEDALPGLEAHVSDFAWRDDAEILALIDEGARTKLRIVTVADDVPAPESEWLYEGPIAITDLDLSRDGEGVALIGSTAEHPSEVFRESEPYGELEPKRLTTSNPWLEEIELAKQEVVTYTARDGLKLEGILIHPLDREPGARVPLILAVHGGPEAHERDGWMTSYAGPGQLAAARGFAVFYPNYRGSTGRGVEFSKLGQADPAGKEFDDLVDAVDHFIETGLADPDRVGITGGSYGGYASAWGATRYSDRFAASVMFVGISDKISKTGTTDIPEEEYLVHARKRPWEDWQFFLERSPIYHAPGAETPILILHGDSDPRVHPSQSMELYRYLKLAGEAPVRLVFYPGEGHGNRRAASRYDYNLRMIRWMEHYLKGPGGDPPSYELEYGLEDEDQDEDDEADS